jgi:hypothetical protein
LPLNYKMLSANIAYRILQWFPTQATITHLAKA